MWIGAGRLVLDFYNNDSLKLKKKNIEELCKDLRRKFNLSILEVSDFDDLEKCVIGFSACLPETWEEYRANQFTQKVAKEIDSTAFARVTVEDLELFYHGP